MPTVMKNALLAALVLTCSACARFENPVVAEEGPRFDDRLAGRWQMENDEGKFDMEIRRDGDEGYIVATGTKEGEEPETDEMRLVTARLERQTFASIADLEEGANWILFRYELPSPDLLVLYLDNEHAWDDAVKNRLLPGKADESGRERSSTVTASSEQLRDFVLGYGSVIFNDQPTAEFRRAPAD